MDILNNNITKTVQQAEVSQYDEQRSIQGMPLESTMFIGSETQKHIKTAIRDFRREKILLVDILYVIRSRKLFIYLVTIMFAVGGFFFTKLTYVPRYFATSSLVFQANYSSEETNVITPVEADFAVSLVPTYTQILKSNRVMDYVIESLDLNIPIEELRSYIELKSVEDTAILHLTVTCPDPQLAIDISNSIAEVAPKAFQETITVGTVRILDAAFISGIVGDRSILISLGVGIVGFFGALAFQLLLYVVLPKVCHATDIQSAIGLPVLSEIEHIRRSKRKKGILLHEQGVTNRFIESYMTLGILVDYISEKKGVKKILVTSSKESEGKTSAVANLGIALARGGKRVLLIDCDLRKPQLHEKFRIEKGSVSQFYGFETKDERRKCIIEISKGLYVLPFINDIDKMQLFFQTSGFSKAVSYFEKEYDIIIFDSTPVYDVTDSLSLASLSDATIMVIKQDDALISEHIKSADKLSAVGGRFLGAIFNDVKFVMKRSKYLDKYSYYRFSDSKKTGQLPS